jgi:hypothetical protein
VPSLNPQKGMALTIVETRAITGGVDTHADVHVAAALDPVGGLLGVREFPTTPAGYAGLLGWRFMACKRSGVRIFVATGQKLNSKFRAQDSGRVQQQSTAAGKPRSCSDPACGPRQPRRPKSARPGTLYGPERADQQERSFFRPL